MIRSICTLILALFLYGCDDYTSMIGTYSTTPNCGGTPVVFHHDSIVIDSQTSLHILFYGSPKTLDEWGVKHLENYTPIAPSFVGVPQETIDNMVLFFLDSWSGVAKSGTFPEWITYAFIKLDGGNIMFLSGSSNAPWMPFEPGTILYKCRKH